MIVVLLWYALVKQKYINAIVPAKRVRMIFKLHLYVHEKSFSVKVE